MTSILLILLFLLIIIIFLGTLFLLSGSISIMFGAPYVPLSRKSIHKILLFSNISPSDTLYDLGCGDGRVLISSVLDFNVQKAVGYEVAPWPYLNALFFIKLKQLKNIKLFRKNFLNKDLSGATFIYLYLFPNLVDKIAYKMEKEGKSGTRIVCVSFPIKLEKHTQFQLVKSSKIDNLIIYLYEFKIH